MVPADSRRIPRVPRYSGYRYAAFRFTYWTITVYGHIFQSVLFTIAYNVAVLQPRWRLATSTVWAVPRSLATTRGIIIYFLFLQVLRCFSSLR